MSLHENEHVEEKETGRIEAFSDGVFAIAITLLILEIGVPKAADGRMLGTPQELLRELGGIWPSYLGYLIGFGTIAIMWMNHHNLFRLVKRSDHGLLLLNSLLLLVVSAIPFPTALVADYISETSGTEKVAAIVYCSVCFVLAWYYNFLWWHISKGNRLIDRRTDLTQVEAITKSYYFGPSLYGAAIALSFVSGIAGLSLCGLLAIFFALPNRVLLRLSKKGSSGLSVR